MSSVLLPAGLCVDNAGVAFGRWREGGNPILRMRFPYVVVTAGYCAIIFYLSSLEDVPVPGLDIPGMDKVMHAVLYGGLAATVWHGLRRSNETVNRGLLFAVPMIFALLYGLSDEYHQLHVPGRAFDWLDCVADGVGAAMAPAGLNYWDSKRSGGESAADS